LGIGYWILGIGYWELGIRYWLLGVEGAFDGGGASIENVGVDHGGFNVFVTKQFLDGADIVAIFQEVGGEGVSENVRGDMFVDASLFCSSFEGFAKATSALVMATDGIAARVI